MEFITRSLRIREFVEGDYPALWEMDSFAQMHTYERIPPTESDTRQGLSESISSQGQSPRTLFRLAITIPPQDIARGIIKINRQWEAIREWEVGWAMHPAEWGKGYATEAAWQVMNYAFKELNVHRIVAFCHAENRASVRVMEKLGMHNDGRLRETRFLNGAWWDEFVYSVLDREWKARNPPAS